MSDLLKLAERLDRFDAKVSAIFENPGRMTAAGQAIAIAMLTAAIEEAEGE